MSARYARRWLASLLIGAAVLAAAAAIGRPAATAPARADRVDDTLVASVRAEPRSFNRYIARDLTTAVVTNLIHSGLVRVDRTTDRLEGDLAERWQLLADRRTYRLHLRPNLRFSDGAPFSADDVVFSFKAIYDREVGSVLADTLQVRGQPLIVAAEDPLTVTIQFPSPFGAGLRMLDGVPIYPRHRLASALDNGSFRSAWGVATAPSDLAGLGPFVLRRYQPGERLIFDRNPYFWRHAAGAPPLQHFVLEVLPDQDAELLQLETGGIDFTQSALRPTDVPALGRATRDGRISVTDAGIGLDGDLLWINLRAAKAADPRSRWLQNADFRRAVAQSVDRGAFVDTVYLGEAVAADSIVSPGNREWHVHAPLPAYDLQSSRRLLDGLGLRDRGGDGVRRDAGGHPARLALLTQKGNSSLERGAEVIRESLAAVGVQVDVVALEAGAVIDRVMRGEYDAAYFRLVTTDGDPALNLDFWLSSGSAHVWNPEQRSAATLWESQIDSLMDQIATTIDGERRRALFADVQRLIGREVPVLCFAFPRQPVAVSTRVVGAMPAPYSPPILWNPAAIGVHTTP
jgi:peptide/nickel transport system substrate-binding protein